MLEAWSLIRSNRNFLILTTSVGTTILAEVTVLAGTLAELYARTGSSFQTILATVVGMATIGLLGSVAGAIADRVSRRLILAGANFMRAVAVGLLLIAVQTNNGAIWHIYLLSIVMAAGSALRFPARLSIMPQIVATEQLVLANSVVKGVLLIAAAFSYWLAGTVSGSGGFAPILVYGALWFCIAGGVTLLLDLPNEAVAADRPTVQPSIWRSALEGFAHLRTHAIARPLVIMEALESIPQGIWTQGMLLIFIERAINGSATDWGVMLGAFQVAFLIGTLVAIRVNRWINRRAGQVIVADTVATAIFGIPFALSTSVEMAILFYFLLALPQALRDTAQDSVLQASVDNEMLGRIYSFRHVGSQLTGLASTLLFAWLADVVNIRVLFLVSVGVFVLVAIYAATNVALRTSKIEAPPLSANARVL